MPHAKFTRREAQTLVGFNGLFDEGDAIREDPGRLTAVFAPTFIAPAPTVQRRVPSKGTRRCGRLWPPARTRARRRLAGAPRLGLAATPRKNPDDWPVSWLGLSTGIRTPSRRRRDIRTRSGARRARLPLTEWLHHGVQAAVGRGCDQPPLTFAELQAADPQQSIDLRIVVTDLRLQQRVVFPAQPGTPSYFYDSDELRTLFPPSVVDHLDRHSRREIYKAPHHKCGLRKLPTDELPVVFAARARMVTDRCHQAGRTLRRHDRTPSHPPRRPHPRPGRVRPTPHGPVVVFLPCAPGSRRLDPDPAATAAAGVRLLVVDRPGYGESSPVADGVASTPGRPGRRRGRRPVVAAAWPRPPSSAGRTAAAWPSPSPPATPSSCGPSSSIGTPAPDDDVPWVPEEYRQVNRALRADPPSAAATLAPFFAVGGGRPGGGHRHDGRRSRRRGGAGRPRSTRPGARPC